MKVFQVFFLVLVISFSAYGQNMGPVLKVAIGQIDLRTYNFDNQPPLDLTGEWEFQRGRLLKPGEFGSVGAPQLLSVPASWGKRGSPSLGFGTYRLRIQLPNNPNGLSIYFPVINTAGKIWINGVHLADAGKVGTAVKDQMELLGATMVAIPKGLTDLELIVQVSNFSYYSGGLTNTPRIGRTDHLITDLNRSNGIANFFAGSLIAMFFYQLILYFLYHRGKPFLWLSLICLGVAMRALVMHGGSFLLPDLFRSVSWEVWKKIEFGSVYAIVSFFPLYIYHLFPDFAPRKVLMFFVTISVILCGFVLVTPQYIYGDLLEVSHFCFVLGFIFAVYSIASAWRRGDKDARVILFGVVAAFPFIILEIMKNSIFVGLELNFMYLVEMGVLVFLLFQVYLLANHYAKSYKDLETLNQGLEVIVENRTKDLVKESAVRDALLSVMSHDVRSPLNSLQGMLNLLNNGHISKEEFTQFMRQIENDLGSTGLLVENILLWTAGQLKGENVSKEKFELLELVNQNIQLSQTATAAKHIAINVRIPEKMEIRWDKNITSMALRNILTNAIKFSHDGGEINISAEISGKTVVIEIKDHGVGMDSATLGNIMSNRRSDSSQGTGGEKGAGLGLSLCRDYLLKAGGSLTVESLEGKGSTFTIVIPR